MVVGVLKGQDSLRRGFRESRRTLRSSLRSRCKSDYCSKMALKMLSLNSTKEECLEER